jgi:hypothetical protein
MGLSWQQGPLSAASVGRFLTPEPLPERLLFVEPLRRRLRVKLAGEWIADSEDVLLLHEPGRYPVAFFPVADVRHGVLVSENRTTFLLVYLRPEPLEFTHEDARHIINKAEQCGRSS